ncbi:unnamed protein product [Enterobius vermicularis]|uniref:Membrane bound O-acyl transferase, MBOAT n=1 Tax=Enterobius vermicularis TaxID=51028 RepID=A0A0N4VPL0_ENTVE|nr:unnamed protein product [Enterobius vermicularis]
MYISVKQMKLLINLVLCQCLSLPLAIIHYKFLAVDKVSRNVRLVFPLTVGLLFCYFCYGNAMKHLLSNVGICLILLHCAPAKHVHQYIFLFSMGYLVFIHWYRWYILTSYSIDVTGPMMVLVQKVTMLAFSLHDGKVKRPEELNAVQKREALVSPPSFLEYMSYMFSFQTVLTGPMFIYKDYLSWISNANTGRNGKFEGSFHPSMIAEQRYLQLDWFRWSLLFFFVIFLQRVQYYYAWTVGLGFVSDFPGLNKLKLNADAICNASGFGFNGYDEFGKPKWDLVSNVNWFKVEMALSFKETLDAWNCCTMYWLRRVAYERTPKRYRTVATYLLSAIWHGFFFGYYLTFLTGALVTVAARTVRRCLRFRFQGSASLRFTYDVLTFLTTKIVLAYATFPFVTMHLNPGLFIYRRLYFFIHILALLAIFVLPIVIPPEGESKRVTLTNENSGTDGKEIKKD